MKRILWLVLLLFGVPLHAQIIPFPSGGSSGLTIVGALPAACNPGQLVYLTSTSLYVCTSLNTWTISLSNAALLNTAAAFTGTLDSAGALTGLVNVVSIGSGSYTIGTTSAKESRNTLFTCGVTCSLTLPAATVGKRLVFQTDHSGHVITLLRGGADVIVDATSSALTQEVMSAVPNTTMAVTCKEAGYWTVDGTPGVISYDLVNGRVGIGTTSPSNPLDVNGNADVMGNLGIGNTSPGAVLDINPGNNSGLQGRLAVHTRTDEQGSGLAVFMDPGTTTPVFLIDAQGSVGIHTGSLTGGISYPFSVAPVTLTSNTAPVIANFTNGTGGTSAGVGATFQFSALNDHANLKTIGQMSGIFTSTVQGSEAGAYTFSLYNGSATNEVMRIQSNGNVGIGTTTPGTTSIVDIVSTTKAFSPPRMTYAQMNAISSLTAGQMVWCLDCTIALCSTPGTGALGLYNGSAWVCK